VVQVCIGDHNVSIAGVLRYLGLKQAGGTHTHISKRLMELEVNTSHFLGQGSNRGPRHVGGCKRREWEDILVLRDVGKREKTYQLVGALTEYGRKYKCTECGNVGEWNDKKLVLQVDHIDGNWLNDAPKNLRFLCPNCHSQSPGWCGKKNTDR